MARRPGRTALGSIHQGEPKRRSRHRDERWDISSATQYGSGRRCLPPRRRGSWPRARASRRCCRCEPSLVSTFTDTRLEPDLEDLLWSTVNLFHRAADRVERELDTNEQAQRRSQHEQDGSEIRSVELERLLAEGLTLIERRNALELMRDKAAELFETHAGSAWRPRAGSMMAGSLHVEQVR